MSYICPHGRRIFDWFGECSACWAEHQQTEAAYAQQDALIEAKKQTKILEDLAEQRESESERETARSKSIEAQELARLAEERFRMDDLRGAVQLISQAIEIQPTFVSFYLQRARYLVRQGKEYDAISDLSFSFKKDKEVLVDFENQIKIGNLNDFISLKSELEVLIQEFKDEARKVAVQSKSHAEAEIERMRLKFTERPFPDFIEEVENSFRRIVILTESNSYLELLRVPKLSEETKNKATKAIALKDDAEKKAKESLAKAEQKAEAILSSQVQKIVPNEVQAARNYLEQAKQFFQTHSFVNFQKSIEFSDRVIQEIQKVGKLLADLRQPLEQKLNEKESVLYKKLSSITDKYNNEISHYEELKRRGESKLREYEGKKPGCGLWIVSFLIGVVLVSFLREIPSAKQVMRSITNPYLFIALFILVPYGILRLVFYSGPKMSAESNIESAKSRIQELTSRKEKELETLRRSFENEFEIVEVRQKIKSLQV